VVPEVFGCKKVRAWIFWEKIGFFETFGLCFPYLKMRKEKEVEMLNKIRSFAVAMVGGAAFVAAEFILIRMAVL